MGDLRAYEEEGGELGYEGLTYRLSEAAAAECQQKPDGPWEGLYYWRFQTEADDQLMIVDVVEWSGGRTDAYAGSMIDEGEVEVYRARGNT